MQLPGNGRRFSEALCNDVCKILDEVEREATSLMSGKQYSFLVTAMADYSPLNWRVVLSLRINRQREFLSPQKHRRTLRILSMIRCIQMMMKWPKYCVVMAELNLIFWMTLISEAYFSYYTQRAVD